jgi:transcriptional regulator with XRE-family HTH domain
VRLADVVRITRRARGLSQLELALAAGTTQDRISAIEAGVDPRLETVRRVAGALSLDVRIGEYCLDTIESVRAAS